MRVGPAMAHMAGQMATLADDDLGPDHAIGSDLRIRADRQRWSR